MEAKKILLVDDDPNDVELALASLDEEDLKKEVAIARDGEEALDYLHRKGTFSDRPEGHPRVIFLDLKMPKKGGLEVLKSIKNDPDLMVIPVVVLTSSNEEKDRIECYKNHANAYVVKPMVYVGLFVEIVKQLGFFWVKTNEPPVIGK